jgi:hypothetical protein
VTRVIEANTTRLACVGEIDKCKPAFGHGRSLTPKVLEPRWCQLGISDRVLDVLVPEIGLQRSGVVAVIRHLVAAGMPEHVRVRLKMAPHQRERGDADRGRPIAHKHLTGAEHGSSR